MGGGLLGEPAGVAKDIHDGYWVQACTQDVGPSHVWTVEIGCLFVTRCNVQGLLLPQHVTFPFLKFKLVNS